MPRFLSLLLRAFGLSLAPASAQLLLTVDKQQRTLSFSGTDTGTPAPTGRNRTTWTGGTGASTTTSLNLQSLFDITGNSFDDTNILLIYESGGLGLVLDFSDADQATLTGNGSTLSYDVYTESQKAILEASNGDVMTLEVGTGWSSINVEVVPEPATGLLFGLGATALLLRRRR